MLPLIKQGNFSSCYGAKLQLYIMQLSLHRRHNFSSVVPFLRLSLSGRIDSVCDVDLHVARTVKQKDWAKSEAQQLKQQTTAPSRDGMKSLCYGVDIRGTESPHSSYWVMILSIYWLEFRLSSYRLVLRVCYLNHFKFSKSCWCDFTVAELLTIE